MAMTKLNKAVLAGVCATSQNVLRLCIVFATSWPHICYTGLQNEGSLT